MELLRVFAIGSGLYVLLYALWQQPRTWRGLFFIYRLEAIVAGLTQGVLVWLIGMQTPGAGFLVGAMYILMLTWWLRRTGGLLMGWMFQSH